MDSKYIGKLCIKIGEEWNIFGVCLGFSAAQMEQLQNAHSKSISKCVIEMLSKWELVVDQHNIDKKLVLAEALREAGRVDLADDLMVSSANRKRSYSVSPSRLSQQFSFDDVDELDGFGPPEQGQRQSMNNRLMEDLGKVKFENSENDPLFRFIAQSKIFMKHKISSMDEFVKTRAFDEALKFLKENCFIIIAGNSGDGKTTIAINILQRLEREGYIVLALSDPSMLENAIDPSRKIVYFIDDAFGTPTLNIHLKDIWVRLYGKIESLVAAKKVIIVLTSRKMVLAMVKDIFRNQGLYMYIKSEFDITNERVCLSNVEKKKMVASYCQGHGLFPSQLMHHMSSYMPGFPLMCKLFSKNPRVRKLGNLSMNPLLVLQKDLKNLLNNDLAAFCMMVLIVLYDGKLPIECLEEMDIDETKIGVVLKAYCLDHVDRNKTISEMAIAANHMLDVYLEEIDEMYVFAHDAIFDAVCLVFGQKNPREVLNIVSSEFIEMRVRTDDGVNEMDDEIDVIILKKRQYKYLAARWIKDIQNGKIRQVLNNPSIKDEEMVDIFLKEIDKLSPIEFENMIGCSAGQSLMEFLISGGHLMLSAQLLKKIKYSNLSPEHGFSVKCLQMAIEHKDAVLVKLLMEFGVRTDICLRPRKMNAVHNAALSGEVHILKLVVEGSKYQCLSSKDENGMQPIHYACQSSSLGCIEYLVSKGTDINSSDFDGRQPIHHASSVGCTSAVKFLRDSGALLCSTDSSLRMPMHFAAMSGNAELVTYMLQQNCNPNVVDATSWTPLLYACRYGHPEVIKTLIDRGADLSICNDRRQLPIHCAAEGCRVEDSISHACIKIILESTTDINAVDEAGKTALHYACGWSFDHRYDCVLSLLKSGAEVNIIDKDNMTPLMYACSGESFDCASLLIQYGAIVDYGEDTLKNKPIHFACGSSGNIEMVKLLLKKSANLKAKNQNGRQPIHFSSQYGNNDVVLFLYWNGVDINVKDNEGKTPLHYACRWSKHETVKLLMKLGANPQIEDNEKNTPKDQIPGWAANSGLIRKYLASTSNSL